MYYIVSRSNRTIQRKRPCEDAKLSVLTKLDYHIYSLEKMETIRPDFFKSGVNHRSHPPHGSVRDFPGQEVWTIELNSQQDIHDFIHENGRIIMSKSSYEECPYAIEIYDMDREHRT